MSLWRDIRAELTGSWRSFRYDLAGRPARRGTAEPDVTCTGLNTFPGSLVLLPDEPVADGERPPRRLATVAAFGALAICGAAGSYLVATTAFAGRMTDPPAVAPEVTPPPRRPAAAATPEATVRPAAADHAGMGRTPRRPPHSHLPVAVTTTTTIVVTPPPATENTRPQTPVTTPPECDCDTPPVPTPTAAEPPVPVPTSTGGPVVPSPAGSSSPTTGHHDEEDEGDDDHDHDHDDHEDDHEDDGR